MFAASTVLWLLGVVPLSLQFKFFEATTDNDAAGILSPRLSVGINEVSRPLNALVTSSRVQRLAFSRGFVLLIASVSSRSVTDLGMRYLAGSNSCDDLFG